MTTQGSYGDGTLHGQRRDRANPIGSLLAIIGIAAFSVAVFLDWLGPDDKRAQGGARSISGYNLNTIIPFTALLGIGLAIALLYAQAKATRRQHRGLTLVTMAVGLAATGLAVAYLVKPPGVNGAADNATSKLGIFVALGGGALWALGAGLFATQAEGDDRYDGTSRGTVAQPVREELYPAGNAAPVASDPLTGGLQTGVPSAPTTRLTARDPQR